jgi:hypothetical protein
MKNRNQDSRILAEIWTRHFRKQAGSFTASYNLVGNKALKKDDFV